MSKLVTPRSWLALALAGTLSAPLSAQGTVRGQVSLLERAGERTADIGDAVIYLEPAEATAPAAAAAARSAQIAMQGRQFLPRVQVVRPGGSVAFPNHDPFSHNVFSSTEQGSFDLGLYGRGRSRSATFERPGVYPIYCNIHSRMVAHVLAVASPFVGQPMADGRYALPAVPAGRYRLHAWHARSPAHIRELEVPPAGMDSVNVQLDARGYKLVPHPNKFGQPYPRSRDRY